MNMGSVSLKSKARDRLIVSIRVRDLWSSKNEADELRGGLVEPVGLLRSDGVDLLLSQLDVPVLGLDMLEKLVLPVVSHRASVDRALVRLLLVVSSLVVVPVSDGREPLCA